MTSLSTRVQTPLRLPKEILEKIDNEADAKGISRNALISQIIYAYVGNAKDE